MGEAATRNSDEPVSVELVATLINGSPLFSDEPHAIPLIGLTHFLSYGVTAHEGCSHERALPDLIVPDGSGT